MIRKPANKSSKRAFLNKQSKIVENTKKVMFLRGTSTSETINSVLRDIYALRKPSAKNFSKRNEKRPFEDETFIEFLGQKNDCSLFVYGSHSKKRPNNLIIGRLFDYHILDMVEFGIDNYKSISEFKNEKSAIGSKPCFIFMGDEFDKDEFAITRNLLLDFFRGTEVKAVNLAGLDHVFICSCVESKIYMRHYSIGFKKSGTKTPYVELEEMGPSFDFTIRRHQFAKEDLRNEATRIPKGVAPKKEKNVIHNAFGDRIGGVHMHSQDMGKLQTRKMKRLKRAHNETEQTDQQSEENNNDSNNNNNDDDVERPLKKKKL